MAPGREPPRQFRAIGGPVGLAALRPDTGHPPFVNHPAQTRALAS
jgi:hypothetical protein